MNASAINNAKQASVDKQPISGDNKEAEGENKGGI